MTIRDLQKENRLFGAVVHGGLDYLAGRVAEDTSLDTEGQTADVPWPIDTLLTESGSDNSRLPSLQIFITDMAEIGAMNRAWNASLYPKAKPARATVQAALAGPAQKVEMTGIATVS